MLAGVSVPSRTLHATHALLSYFLVTVTTSFYFIFLVRVEGSTAKKKKERVGMRKNEEAAKSRKGRFLPATPYPVPSPFFSAIFNPAIPHGMMEALKEAPTRFLTALTQSPNVFSYFSSFFIVFVISLLLEDVASIWSGSRRNGGWGKGLREPSTALGYILKSSPQN